MKIVQIGIDEKKENHFRILSEIGVLSAICDIDSSKARKYGEKYSVNHYDTLEKLLDSEEFHGVIIATPTFTDFEIITKFLEVKKHVFVENPMTFKSEEGEKLIKLAEKKKVVLTWGYNDRFNPSVSEVKKIVKENKFGDVVMLELHNENRISLNIKNVGIIFDSSVHDIDIANLLFEELPILVFAKARKIKHEYEDFASIMLGYKNDKVAIISSNWVTPKKLRKFNVVYTDAIISSDFNTQEIIIEKQDGVKIIQNEKQESSTLEIQSFLGAIEGKNEQIIKAQQAVNVTKIAEAALLSSQKGIPIYLDLK
jgi:UDP-N-acetylglucosamine 3-dehydrogenase